MPFVPVPETALVEVRMLLDLQQVENTIWVLKDGGHDAGTLAALATNVKSWWGLSMAPLLSDQVTLREVTATDMSTDTGPQVSVDGELTPGEQIGGSAPSNVSFVVSFRTNARGRAFRGRNYVVGVPLTQLAAINTVEASWAAQLRAAYQDLSNGLLDDDFLWVIASRFSGVGGTPPRPIPRETGVTTAVSSIITTDLTIDSQRRRLPGRGT